MSPDVFDAKSSTNTHTSVRAATSKSSQESHRVSKIGRKPSEYSSVLANEHPNHNSWSAYAPLPVGIKFASQGKDEEVLMFLRQHPIVNLPWIVIAIAMIFAPFLIMPIFQQYLRLPINYVFIAWLGWYLITAGFIVERTLMWLFNSFIITDERMVDIDFTSLIYKKIDYAQLDKIQEVSVQTGGLLNSVVDIGSVFVQTAAEVPEFVFNNIAHPTRVAKLLDELVEEEQQEFLEGRVR